MLNRRWRYLMESNTTGPLRTKILCWNVSQTMGTTRDGVTTLSTISIKQYSGWKNITLRVALKYRPWRRMLTLVRVFLGSFISPMNFWAWWNQHISSVAGTGGLCAHNNTIIPLINKQQGTLQSFSIQQQAQQGQHQRCSSVHDERNIRYLTSSRSKLDSYISFSDQLLSESSLAPYPVDKLTTMVDILKSWDGKPG